MEFCKRLYIVYRSIKESEEDIGYSLYYIVKDVEKKFLDVEFMMKQLSVSLGQAHVLSNVKVMEEIFSFFIDKHEFEIPIPFGPMYIYNDKMEIITGTDPRFRSFKEDQIYPQYIEESKEHPFKLYINKITYGYYIRKSVIPLTISVVDQSNNYVGIVWSSILVDELNDQLTSHYANSEYLGNIKLRNNKKNDVDGSYIFNEVKEAIPINSILKCMFQGSNIFVHKELNNYPFVVEL